MPIEAAQLNRNLKEESKVKTKFIWLITSCLMVVALILASCAPAVVEEKKATVVTKEPEKKVEKVEEVVEPETKYGGTITTYSADDPLTWDIEDHTSFKDYNYMYDTLVITDWWAAQEPGGAPLTSRYECVNRPDLWVGHLAESWDWSDPLTMTFKIRKGIRWQNKPPANGREFTADDVVFQLDRMLNNPKRATQILVTNTKSVTAPDKYTVVFKFNEPNVLMLYEIGFAIWMECPDVVQTYGNTRDWKTLAGTGPWMLTDFIPGVSITYEKNPDYFLKDPDGNQLPYIDYGRVLIIKDAATQVAALRTAKVDKVQVYYPLPWDQKEIMEQTKPDMQFVVSPSGGFFNLLFRNIKEPFTDVRVRQALNMVVRRQDIVDVLLGGNGTALAWPAADFWPCFTPLEELPAGIREIYDYKPENIAKAKQLLADAGYPNGFNTSVQYNITSANVPFGPGMELLKTWWAEIGVDLELIPIDRAAASALRQFPFPYDNILGIGGGQESPEKILDGKFRTGGSWNRAIISDPYVDEMFFKGMKEFDLEKRNAIWKEVYQYLLEQAFDLTFPRINNFMAWYPWVKGYNGQAEVLNRGEGHIWARIWIDQALKKTMTGR